MINICFVFKTPIILTNLKGLIEKMSRDSIFNIVIFEHLHNGQKQSDDLCDIIASCKKIKMISASEMMKLHNYYIFMNRPYLRLLLNDLNINNIAKNNKLLNINYAYHIHKELYNITYAHENFKYFYASFHECKENYDDFVTHIKKNDANFDVSRALLSGSTKVQYLKEHRVQTTNYFNNSNTFFVLFSFRWEKISKNNTEHLFLDKMIGLIECMTNINFIFRPHALYDVNSKLFKITRDNYYIDLNTSYQNSFDISNVLITDLSTLISDYFIYTKNPIILMKNSNKKNCDILNSFGMKIIDGIYEVSTCNELSNSIENLANGNDELRMVRINIAKEFDIYNADEYIIDFVLKDSGVKLDREKCNDMNIDYWKKFYCDAHNLSELNKPSPFCLFVIDYLKDIDCCIDTKKLVDLDCGNGRDLKFLSNFCNSCGIDLCTSAIETLSKQNMNVFHKKINDVDTNYDIYYSRFSIHAMNIEDIIIFFNKIKEFKTGSIIFIETRSTKGTEYYENDYAEVEFKSSIGDVHKRTLLSKKYIDVLIDRDFYNILHFTDENNVAIFGDENPYVIRLVLTKK